MQPASLAPAISLAHNKRETRYSPVSIVGDAPGSYPGEIRSNRILGSNWCSSTKKCATVVVTVKVSNEYRRNRYAARIAMATSLLGGKCMRCGSTDDLEFDHVDPGTKLFEISAEIANLKFSTILDELSKCQLLCKPCHVLKTLDDKGQAPARNTHGTVSSYRYCRCELCKEAKREWARRHYGSQPKRDPPDHGEYRMYRSGCRCSLCRSANSERIRSYRREKESAGVVQQQDGALVSRRRASDSLNRLQFAWLAEHQRRLPSKQN
jgi:hypothetical protein